MKVLARRMGTYLAYYLLSGRSSYPESVTLFLTHRCNLHCVMCGQWGESGITKKMPLAFIGQELKVEELKHFIDDIAFFSPNITLFGGEPLLYPSCVELIKYIKKKRMHCLMITNGALLENMAEEVVESGLDELNVSLDAGKALHEQIRGMTGLFDAIMRGIKRVNYFKTKKNKNAPFINLQCTITQHNYRHLEQLIGVATEAGADSLTFHNLIFTNKELLSKQREVDKLLDCTSSDWEGFVFPSGIEPELLYEKIRNILSGDYRFNVDFYPNFSYQALLEYYRDPSRLPSDYPGRCLSPWMVAYVFPDGEVRPCLNCSYSFGSIKNEKFRQIWNSQKAVNYRRLLKQKQFFPVCVRCSELYRY